MEKKVHFNLITKFFIGAFVLLGLIGCEKDDDTVLEPKLFLETEAVDVSNAGGEYTVEVLSNLPWQAEASSEWITLTETSGDKGKFVLGFSVAENDDDERTGAITIWTTEDQEKEILLKQEAGNRDNIFVKENGAGDGFSWDSPVTLSKALAMAVTGNTVHIAEGTYVPAKTVTGGDSADEGDKTFEISSNVTLIGGYPANAEEGAEPDYTKYPTILSGEGSSYHVVTVSAPAMEGFKVVLKGLKITQGNASGSASSVDINGTDFRRDYGGGITIGNAIVDIIDTEIVDNKSGRNVAGLYAFGGSTVTIKRSKVNRNLSDGNAGGVWISESIAYIYDSEFNNNEGGTAAGVHAYPDASIYMYNSVISGNKGRSYGAAFYIRQNSKGLLVNCVISGNSSTSDNGGGGVMMYNNNEMTIISSTITENKILGPGGGVYRQKGTNTLHVYNSIISGNEQKDDGPEVDVYEADAVVPVIQSSVIGDGVYGDTGEEIEGVAFNINTMLEKSGEFIFVPVGEENPAREYGMTAEELIELGSKLTPTVEEDIMAFDLLYNSRADLNVMGALVDDE